MSAKGEMKAISDKCTGCLLCQFACSYMKTRAYSVSQALLSVARAGMREKYTVSFKEECDACGYCVKYCAFDAISRKRVRS